MNLESDLLLTLLWEKEEDSIKTKYRWLCTQGNFEVVFGPIWNSYVGSLSERLPVWFLYYF